MRRLAIVLAVGALVLPVTLPGKSRIEQDLCGQSHGNNAADNLEMASIFQADQADRQTLSVDWAVVGPRDDARFARTAILVDQGDLKTGNDLFRAAFVYQHGRKPDDFLRSHALAMAAMACGNRSAAWIASASLDRYLQATGKPQIFGTQYKGTREGKLTQDPFDQGLIPDSLRTKLGVPSIVDQAARGRELEAGLQKAK